ncbi:hypothetical protein Avbf_12691 [Armadillidium vulgare]|nr:hypothetical protein Avbf_12691 [Armadillidium vulgare]
MRECEKSSLLMQISSLQQELSDAHENTKSNQFSFHSDIPDKNQSQEQSETVHKKGRAKNFSKSVKESSANSQNSFAVSSEFAKCSETSSTNDSPVKRKHTRPGRAAKAKKDITSSGTSTTKNMKRGLADTSEGEDLSNSQPQYSRGRRGKTDSAQKSVTNIPDSPEVGFRIFLFVQYQHKVIQQQERSSEDMGKLCKGTQEYWVPRSTRKKNLNLQFYQDSESNEKESAEEENDKSEDEFVPQKTTRSCRKPRRGGKSSSKLFNPHLDDKENTSKNATVEDSLILKTEEGKRVARTRGRRRPLYSIDVEEPYQCSPSEIEDTQRDSPHTVVRRNLRSKAK